MPFQQMKWISIATLLLAMCFWSPGPLFQLALALVVTVSAIVVLIQAWQAKKYWWAAGFLVVATLFNPALPLIRLSGGVGFSLVLLVIVPFAISLVVLKPHRLLSIPSITDRNPGSHSL
jgi:hypothetical protein